jgi:hypothetical protein
MTPGVVDLLELGLAFSQLRHPELAKDPARIA